MAVDVCYTSEVSISPRFSFSRDLDDPSSEINSIQSDPNRSDQFLLSPTFDFDFCTTSNLTPADELFSNGKILPTQIKNPRNTHLPGSKSKLSPSENQNANTQKKCLKEFIFHNEEQEKSTSTSTSRSFWQFRRSTSLNCDNGKGPKGLLRSLSIKSLSRSNSTGSALFSKRNQGPKAMERSKDPVSLRRSSSLSQPPPPSFSSTTHMYYSYQNSNGSRNSKGGIRIIPVLNIPPAYNISKGTMNFFGFGSLLCNGKAKKKTKS